MAVYRMARSPYWWMRCARPGLPPLRESTKIPVDAPTADQRKRNRLLAEAAYNTRMGDLARSRYQLPEATPTLSRTMTDWIGWYRTHVVPSHRGAERERETLRRFDRAFGAIRLADLTRTPILEWMTARQAETGPSGRQISPSTINREMDVLKRLLAVAVEHGELDASPIVNMPRLHAPTPRRRVMSLDEEAQLLAALRQPADRALLILALDTLARLGDCLDLRWQDDHGTTVWFGDPKTGSGYHAPVTTRLRAALDAIPKDGHDYVFWRKRLPETAAERRSRVSHMLRRACERCDPPLPYGRATGGLSWHWATRRTAATRMILAGAAISTVQRAGRWQSSRVVADIYLDTEDALVRAAVEGIGNGVASLPLRPRQRKRAVEPG